MLTVIRERAGAKHPDPLPDSLESSADGGLGQVEDPPDLDLGETLEVKVEGVLVGSREPLR